MNRLQITTLLGIFILIFSSCHEITVKTKINIDGSFTRTIIVNGENKDDLYKAKLPYPIDDSWIVLESYDSTNKGKPFILTYSKDFAGIEELSYTLAEESNLDSFPAGSIDIHKRQGFFYSYLIFEEKINCVNPYPHLDFHDYLSDEDLIYLRGAKAETDSITEEKLNNASEKAGIFIEESISSGIIMTLKDGISQLNTTSLTPEIVDQYEDSIRSLVQWFEIDHQEQYIDSLFKWSDNAEVLKLKDIEPSIFLESDKKMKLFIGSEFGVEEYNQIVELPGLLTETNSFSPVGNTVSWKVTPLSYVIDDFSMYAESRVINYWGFIVTGVVILLLIVLLLVKAFRK